jgi:hypothetical protein
MGRQSIKSIKEIKKHGIYTNYNSKEVVYIFSTDNSQVNYLRMIINSRLLNIETLTTKEIRGGWTVLNYLQETDRYSHNWFIKWIFELDWSHK